MGTLPSTRTMVTRPLTERTSTRPTAPGTLSTNVRTSSSESTILNESWCSSIQARHCWADILFKRCSVTASPAETRCSTSMIDFPSGHFLVSDRKILESCTDVIVLTAFCFETTTAIWLAQQGHANL